MTTDAGGARHRPVGEDPKSSPKAADASGRGGSRDARGSRPQRSSSKQPTGEEGRKPHGRGHSDKRRGAPDRANERHKRVSGSDRAQRTGRDHRRRTAEPSSRSRNSSPRGDRSQAPRRQSPAQDEASRRREELRPVRAHHDDPSVPEGTTHKQLDRDVQNQLRPLTEENAEWVGGHLVMAARLIESDPELAHRHAISASRRGGRIGVVRETVAITAYRTGDFGLALREFRTYRRITGSNEHLALMVDSERGVDRPKKALELGRSVDRTTLSVAARVGLAIAMSGARLDLGQLQLAESELQIPQLDGDVAYPWSPELFRAYAEVQRSLGNNSEEARWMKRAEVAEEALSDATGAHDDTVEIVEEELPTQAAVDGEATSSSRTEEEA